MKQKILEQDKKYKGVLFDFNGTLFWDTPLHNAAWNKFMEKHKLVLTDEEKDQKIHGKNNQDILRGLFNTNFSVEELNALTLEKETIYQQMCLEINMELAPGAIDFIKFLQQKKVPFTIATASGKENIDFYFSHLKLGNWFDYETVVYNDGSFLGKPNPDIFLIAARRLGVKPEDAIAFEDSRTGLAAAKNAGVGKIYIVNSTKNYSLSWPCEVINSFEEVDRSLFC